MTTGDERPSAAELREAETHGCERVAIATGLKGAPGSMDEERYTPNQMERDAQRTLDELIPLRDAETDERKRKELSRRIKNLRIARNWARTRAGYVKGA